MRAAERPDVGLEALASALGSQARGRRACADGATRGPTHRDRAGRRTPPGRAGGRGRAARRRRPGGAGDGGRAVGPRSRSRSPPVLDAGGASWFVTPWVEGDVGARVARLAGSGRSVLARAMGTLQRSGPRDRPAAGAAGLRPRRLRADQRRPRRRWDGRRACSTSSTRTPATRSRTLRGGAGSSVTITPDAWSAAWPTFCSAAGVDLDRDGPTLRALMLGELSHRAAATVGDPDRRRWLDRLAEASAW